MRYSDGRKAVGHVLRQLLANGDVDTVLVILQDYVELEAEFDDTDIVSRSSDGISVVLSPEMDGLTDTSF